MNPTRKLRVTLTFSIDGVLQDIFLIAGNSHEEALLRKAIAPALKVYKLRRAAKRVLLWMFNHRIFPRWVTQRIFDLLKLKNI